MSHEVQPRHNARHCPQCGVEGIPPLDQAHESDCSVVDPVVPCPVWGLRPLSPVAPLLASLNDKGAGLNSIIGQQRERTHAGQWTNQRRALNLAPADKAPRIGCLGLNSVVSAGA